MLNEAQKITAGILKLLVSGLEAAREAEDWEVVADYREQIKTYEEALRSFYGEQVLTLIKVEAIKE